MFAGAFYGAPDGIIARVGAGGKGHAEKFAFMILFRTEISDAFRQIRRMRRGKFLGQEIELDDMLERDETSRLLSGYLVPNGTYSQSVQTD